MDEQPPLILVRETKFGKTRVVPVHSTTAVMLREYATKKRKLGYDGFTDAFFVSERGRRLHYNTVGSTFRSLVRRAGIQRTLGGRRPTLHSCRHTFAVRRLVAWHHEGVNVKSMLPHLSVYMGHTDPKNTYWYLSATPELLSVVAQSFESYANQGNAR
jgi:integrase